MLSVYFSLSFFSDKLFKMVVMVIMANLAIMFEMTMASVLYAFLHCIPFFSACISALKKLYKSRYLQMWRQTRRITYRSKNWMHSLPPMTWTPCVSTTVSTTSLSILLTTFIFFITFRPIFLKLDLRNRSPCTTVLHLLLTSWWENPRPKDMLEGTVVCQVEGHDCHHGVVCSH